MLEQEQKPSRDSIIIVTALFRELKKTNYVEICFNRNINKFILCSRYLSSCKIYTWKESKLHSKQVYLSDVDFTDFVCIYSLEYVE